MALLEIFDAQFLFLQRTKRNAGSNWTRTGWDCSQSCWYHECGMAAQAGLQEAAEHDREMLAAAAEKRLEAARKLEQVRRQRSALHPLPPSSSAPSAPCRHPCYVQLFLHCVCPAP